MRTDLQRLKRDSESGRSSAAISGPAVVLEPPPAPVRKALENRGSCPARRRTRRRRAFTIGGISKARLTDKDTIVLTDFANSTGDAIFDDTLKTALNVSLRQSPFLNVLSDGKVAETLQMMTRPAEHEDSRLSWPASFASGRAARLTLPDRLAVSAANMCWD